MDPRGGHGAVCDHHWKSPGCWRACLSALDVGVVASLWSKTIARGCGRDHGLRAAARIHFSRGVMPDLLPASALVAPGMWTRWLACCGGRQRMRLGGGAWPGIAPSGLCPSGTRIFSEQTLAVYAGSVPSAVFIQPFNFGMVPLSRQSALRTLRTGFRQTQKSLKGRGGRRNAGGCSPILQKIFSPPPNASMPFQSSSA